MAGRIGAMVLAVSIGAAVYTATEEVTRNNTYLLARMIHAEARGEGVQGMMMVGQCALDRVASDRFGDTLHDVVTAKGQFALSDTPGDEAMEVAEALIGGARYDADSDILYFRATTSSKDWYAPYLGHEGAHAYYGHREEELTS